MLQTKKLDELIVYLGSHPKVQDLGTTKLWKLIYFIEAESMRELGGSITHTEFIKYDHGPVPSRGDKRLRKLAGKRLKTEQRKVGSYVMNEITSIDSFDESVFTQDELEIVDRVCERIGRYTAANLSDMSHKEPSWICADRMGKLSPELIAYGVEEDPDGL